MLALMLLSTACTHDTLRVDGLRRRYIVHTPPAYDGETPLPVMLVLHGGGGNAESTQVSSGMDATADANGFIAVYPEGTGTRRLGTMLATWNGGLCCGQAVEDEVDDVAFIDRLLDRLERRYAVDPERIYATGISNGGSMAWRLAAELPQRIAGVAPIASPGPDPAWSLTPVPTLIFHGTQDGCALWDGGEECGGCWERAVEQAWGVEMEERSFPCMGVTDQLASRVEANGCSDTATVSFERGDSVCVEYRECTSGAPVGLCTIQGGGHTWPGHATDCDPEAPLCEAFLDVCGTTSTDLDANQAMWAFFEGLEAQR